MAAQIIENGPDTTDTDDLPLEEGQMTPEELAAANSVEDNPKSTAPAEEDIPDKYRGKSIRDVVAMHQEAEKLIGKQGSEVGELRQVFDEYIKGQLSNQNHAPVEEEEELDFFEDPRAAVSKAIETHPDVLAARQAAVVSQRKESIQTLQAKHPDMEQVLGNPEFLNWSRATPTRRALFAQADKQYDFDAADELISNFKALHATSQQTLEGEKVARREAVKSVSTGSASGTSASTDSRKKIYRRADIIKLIKTDPRRYEQMSPELELAYREGRVR